MDTHSFLLALHILGLAFGLGGALMLDAALVGKLRGAPLTPADVALSCHLSRFVKLGLCLLWLSGSLLIATAQAGPATVLADPKVQAKLVIVVALTLNAVVIERLALPLVARNRGRPLFFGVSPMRRTGLLASGVVSGASWLAPLLLGLAKSWDGRVPAADILAAWLGVITLAGLATIVFVSLPRRRGIPRAAIVGGAQRSVSLNSIRRLRA